MTPPPLTDEQRTRARQAALRARRERAALKHAIEAGRIGIAEALSSPDPVCRRMRVRELLQSLPGVGPQRSTTIMSAVGIAPTRRVQGLSLRQREELLAAVSHRGPRSQGRH